MPRYITNKDLSGNLNDHPAVHAWSKVMPDHTKPDSIKILYEHRRAENRGKSAVYLLEGVGPSGSAVVAKRCNKNTALIESRIYSEILSRLPVSALRYYGLLEEENAKFSWLFLENAGGKPFLPNHPAHRVTAGRWLGKVHSSAVHIDEAAGLPFRGPNHYRDHLKSAYELINPYIYNSPLDAESKSILMKIMVNLDFLETHWQELEGICNDLPNTIVHGDFSAKNIHIRKNHNDEELIVFDWEYAGWGPPVVDLAQSPLSSMHSFVNPDISTYWDTVKDQWSDLDIYTLERIANVGTLFRILTMIYWAALGLSHEWYLHPMEYLTIYEDRLSLQIRSGKWRR